MIFTMGHSTLDKDEFARAASDMDVIIDVRSHPTSTKYPHFNKEEMKRWTKNYGLRYLWSPGLGGWRIGHTYSKTLIKNMAQVGVDITAYDERWFPKQRIAANRKPNGTGPEWTSQGLYDYSWYTTTDDFLDDINWLVDEYGTSVTRAAIMCSEAQWWRCHRSQISDVVAWMGIPTFHLPSRRPKHTVAPWYQSHFDVIGNRIERYDPRIKEKWTKGLRRDLGVWAAVYDGVQ